MQKLRKCFEEKKVSPNDLEMSNSARNGKKKWRQMAVFSGTGGIVVFLKFTLNLYKK